MARRAADWPVPYAVAFALAPALAIAARSVGQYRVADLMLVLIALALLTTGALGLLYAIVRLVDHGDRAGPRVAALGLLAVLWCFYYLPAQSAVAGLSRRLSDDRVLVPIAAAATLVAAAWLVAQSRERLLAVGAFFTRFGLLLVGLEAARVLAAAGAGPRIARHSRLVHELAAPVPASATLPPGRNTPPRDVYVIVLDGHANGRVLEEVFRYDNRHFEDSLRSLGFVVPRDMRSNYVQTYLSASSLLNAAHVTGLAADAGISSKDHSLPTYLVKHNRAARLLKERGYKYVLFPSAWWAATAGSPLADVEFDPDPAFRLSRELRRTELRAAVLRSTLLRYLPGTGGAALPLVEHFLRSFEGLGRLPEDPEPTFAFAHFLLPHIPYLLDASCRPLAHEVPDDQEADTPEQRADYVGQVRCADRLVLELVTRLIRESSPPPIILIVGDHGPRFSDIGFYAHPDRVSPAFVRERFGAFGAFYLPAGGDSAFQEPVTLVNVLGNVLRYYFGLRIPRAEDELYVSGEQPYRFYRADPRLLEAPGRAAPAAGDTT